MKEWTQLTTKRYAGRRRSAPGGRFVVLVTPAVRICCTFCPGNRAKTYTRCAEQALRFGGSSPVSSRGTRQSERNVRARDRPKAGHGPLASRAAGGLLPGGSTHELGAGP